MAGHPIPMQQTSIRMQPCILRGVLRRQADAEAGMPGDSSKSEPSHASELDKTVSCFGQDNLRQCWLSVQTR